jgi:pimeloyl-ACP methyl ester carboxylesterase
MSYATSADGVQLHYEETGAGTPILFVHEFAGDHRSWEPQVRAFARRYRCVTYDARGYPPSDVPDDPKAYSQARAVEDAVAVLDAAGIERAHVVGLSMGGFCALHLGLRHPGRCLSVVAAGAGYGAEPSRREGFRAEAEATAEGFRTKGSAEVAKTYALGPARVQFQVKDPRGWAEFAARLAEHDATGSALTQLGVQRERPSLYDLRDELADYKVPLLVITGDEDEGCLDANLYLKRTVPTAALVVLPKTGHTLNLEEPDLFNQHLQWFLSAVESGRWTPRDPRSISRTLT